VAWGTRNGGGAVEAEVGVARGRAVRDVGSHGRAGWRPVRLASFKLTLGSDMNGVDE